MASDLPVCACGVYPGGIPNPCFEELIDTSAALGFRDLFKRVANGLLNDYGRVSWFGHLHSASRRDACISALYLKSLKKNYKLEIDLPATDRSQNSFRKSKVESKSIQTRPHKYIYKFFRRQKMILGCEDRTTVNLEAFINFYINEKIPRGSRTQKDPIAPETDLGLLPANL